jgi:hypothetical protein
MSFAVPAGPCWLGCRPVYTVSPRCTEIRIALIQTVTLNLIPSAWLVIRPQVANWIVPNEVEHVLKKSQGKTQSRSVSQWNLVRLALCCAAHFVWRVFWRVPAAHVFRFRQQHYLFIICRSFGDVSLIITLRLWGTAICFTKMIAFWDRVSRSLVGRPDDGRSKHLWNVAPVQGTASSYSPPWEPKFLRHFTNCLQERNYLLFDHEERSEVPCRGSGG